MQKEDTHTQKKNQNWTIKIENEQTSPATVTSKSHN